MNFNKVIDKVTGFFGVSDTLPWTDAEIIERCEREAYNAEPGVKNHQENIFRLAWALVHSKKDPDIQRGVAMLEDIPLSDLEPNEKREILYLLAVGQYRLANYLEARKSIKLVMEISPKFRQGESLKKVIEDKIKTEGLMGVGIAAGSVALVVAAALIGASKR